MSAHVAATPVRLVVIIAMAVCREALARAGNLRVDDGNDPGSSFEEAVAEANVVSNLTDLLKLATMRQERLNASHADAKRFYEHQKELLERQIRARHKQMEIHARINDTGYRLSQEEHLKSMTCTILLDAFVFDNVQDKKLRVMDICLGRENLTFAQTQVGRANVRVRHLRGRRAARSRKRGTPQSVPGLTSLTREARELGFDIQSLLSVELHMDGQQLRTRSSKPSDRLRTQLEALLRQNKQLQAEMAMEKAQWQNEVSILNDEEQALGDLHSDTYHGREQIEDEEFAKVKGTFCPLVHTHYGISEEELSKALLQECNNTAA